MGDLNKNEVEWSAPTEAGGAEYTAWEAEPFDEERSTTDPAAMAFTGAVQTYFEKVQHYVV